MAPRGLRTRLSPHLLIAMEAKPCKCCPDAEFLEVQALNDGKTNYCELIVWGFVAQLIQLNFV